MLTEIQVHEAIRQMVIHCRLLMVQPYEVTSARRVLQELGYEEHMDQVLRHIADGGFDYCLDHTIPMTGHHEARGEKPDPDVCYWGPDQLESRLRCLRNVPYWVTARQPA